jgi:hypothetical protein
MLRAPRAWSGGHVDECNLAAWRTRRDCGVTCEAARWHASCLIVHQRGARNRRWLTSSEGCLSAYEYRVAADFSERFV